MAVVAGCKDGIRGREMSRSDEEKRMIGSTRLPPPLPIARALDDNSVSLHAALDAADLVQIIRTENEYV